MRFERSLHLVNVHCQGEIGRVIVEGADPIPGATLLDQMNHINAGNDALRRFVTFEPRASVAMSTNLLVPPAHPEADAGFIVLQADRAHPMSGSNCICVVTALLETGRVSMREPETVLRIDTPAGLITARARCSNGRCLSVSLDNVPSFVEALDRAVETERWGTIKADIAFGGVFYAIVDVGQVGLRIDPAQARALAEAGIELKAALAGQVSVSHPDLPGLEEVAYVMFRDQEADGAIRTCTTLKPGRVDRSPCGTGSSANLATLHAREPSGSATRGSRAPSSAASSRSRRSARRSSAAARPCCRASPAKPGSTAAKNFASMTPIPSRAASSFRIVGVRRSTSWIEPTAIRSSSRSRPFSSPETARWLIVPRSPSSVFRRHSC